MKWKILSSEYLFKETWFTVRRDTCETPDGKIISPYYVYEFPTWVTALALSHDKQVIMVKQYRHAIGETILEIPGGCVDDDDKSLEEAIARELIEETGYKFEKYNYLGKISPNPSTNSNWMHMFLATGGKKVQELKLDHNEDIEVVVISFDELKQLLKENKIVQAMHATTILYALQKLEEIKY
jgi:8-oxo-dGTP pyrophosphatase MutT (NUDIX family)